MKHPMFLFQFWRVAIGRYPVRCAVMVDDAGREWRSDGWIWWRT